MRLRSRIALAALCMAATPVSAETVNRIVAIVNDTVITEADIATQLNALLDDPDARQAPDTNPEEMRRVVLRRLIEQQLILQEAKRSEITVANDEVAQRLEELRGRFDSAEAFQDSLAQSGLSEEQLKATLRDQLLVQRVVDGKVRSTVTVSPQEVAQELAAHPELSKPGDRVHAAHILVRADAHRSEAEAHALIQDLHRQLQAGGDFAELAKHYSEDSHRDEGGELGWMAQGDLLPELDGPLFTLPSGAVSDPIQTRLGFHLVKVVERRSADSLGVGEANRTITQQLYRQKFQAAFTRWITDLKRRAYIELIPVEGR